MNLRLKRVAALVDLGRFDEAQEELGRTAAWAEENGDALLAARVTLRRAASAAYWDKDFSLEPAIAEVERLVPVFEAAEDDAALAEAFETQARFASWLGRHADADRLYALAVDHAARSNEPRRRMIAYSWWLGVKRNGPFPVEEAIEFLDAIPDDLRESLEWNASRMRAALEALRGNFDEAHELIEAVAARARETGTMFTIVWSLTTRTQIAFAAGDWAAAERASREAWEMLGAAGEAAVRESVGGSLSIALARQGRFDEAEAVAIEASGDHRPDSERDTRSWLALALVRVARGDLDEAERLAREAVRIVDRTDETERRAEAWTVLGEVLAHAGNPAGAADAFDRAEQLYAARGAIAGVRWVRDVRAALERGLEWAG